MFCSPRRSPQRAEDTGAATSQAKSRPEGTDLENRSRVTPDRGFESRPLRSTRRFLPAERPGFGACISASWLADANELLVDELVGPEAAQLAAEARRLDAAE